MCRMCRKPGNDICSDCQRKLDDRKIKELAAALVSMFKESNAKC